MNIRPTQGSRAAAATGAPDGNDGNKDGRKMGISGVSSSGEAPQTSAAAGAGTAGTSGADGATAPPQPATPEQQDATQTEAEANTGDRSPNTILQQVLGRAMARKRRAPEPPTAQQNQDRSADAAQTSATTSQSAPSSPSLPGKQGALDLKQELGKLVVDPRTSGILNPSSQTGQKQTASAPSSPTGSRKTAAAEQESTRPSSAPASPTAGRKAKQVVTGLLKRLTPQPSSGPKAKMAKTTGAASPSPSQRSATPPPRPPPPRFSTPKAAATSPTPPQSPQSTMMASGPSQAATGPSIIAPPGFPPYLIFTLSEEGMMELAPYEPTAALRVNSLIVKTEPDTGRSRLMVARATGLLEPATSDETRAGDCAGLWPVDVGGKIVTVNISGNGEISFP